MSSNDGSLLFDTKINTTGFEKDATSLKSLANNVVKTVGLTISAGAIAKGLTSIAKQGIEAASDLEEVQNVVDVTFGDGADQIESWAKAAVTSYGLSETAAKQYAGTIGAMLKSMDVADDEVLEMSENITGLAADFASFYNLDHDEAFSKIRSGLSGETEPLKQLGINMSTTNLEAYRLAQGIETAYSEMTQAEQVILRYNYLLSVSADAQGDFARTSTSYANATRIMETNLNRISTGIGKTLLPTVTKATVELGSLSSGLADAIDTGGIEGGLTYIETEFPLATAAVKGLAVAYGTLTVIKTISNLTKSYALAQKTITQWLAAGTAQEVIEAGVLTAKQTIIAGLTGKISLLTAAQAIYNTTLAANPIMLAVTALGLLVTSVTLAERAIVKNNTALQEAEDNALSLKNQVSELRDSIEDSAESYRSSTSSIESNLVTVSKLSSKLEEMSAAYTGTNTEQEIMKSLCEELNNSVSGLSVSFDTQTGKLNMTAEAMRKYAQEAADTAVREAAVERYTELLVEQAEAEYNLAQAEASWKAVQEGTESSTLRSRKNVVKAYNEAYEAVSTVNAEVEKQGSFLDWLGIKLSDTTEAVEDVTDAMDEAANAEERVVIGGYDVTDLLESAGLSAEDASKRFDTYTSAAQNMFDVISTESEYSVSQMIENLNKNAEAMEQYGDNLAALAGRIPDDLYNALAGDPDKYAGVVSTLAAASDEEIATLSESYTRAGEAAGESLAESLGAIIIDDEELPTTKAAEAIEADTSMETAGKNAVQNTLTAMKNEVITSNFSTVGTQIINGLITGMNSQSGSLYAAGQSIVQNLLATMKATAAISSPSKITTGYGEYLSIGWANGIKKKLGIVRSAARSVVQASLSEFSAAGYPSTYQVQESSQTATAGTAGATTSVIQNIYAQAQTPSEMLREAQWLQRRAVLVGV